MNTDLVVVVNASKEAADAPLGGIQKAVIAQLAALRAGGAEVVLLSAARRCADAAIAMGCEVHYDPRWHNAVAPLVVPSLVGVLIRIRRRGPVALLHHSGRTWLWTHVVFAGIPNIAVLHREVVRPYRFFRRWLALSPGYADELKAGEGIGRKLAWAPNCLMSGEPLERTGPLQGQRSPAGSFVMGFVGRASAGKGLDVLLQALRGVRERGLDVRLELAGTVDPWVFEAAERYGVADAVATLGWFEDMQPFFARIDCLVLPSEKESFGLVLIEAMEVGLPVIATACNGPRSIVEDGETGFLVPIGNLDRLIAAVEQLVVSPDLARCFGEKGRERVALRYTPQAASGVLIAALGQLGAEFKTLRAG